MTPEPRPTWRSSCICRERSPKKKRNIGSSVRGVRAGARLAVMLTTDGEARLAAFA